MYLAYPSAAASKDFEEPVGDKIPVLENITLCTGWAITFPPIKIVKTLLFLPHLIRAYRRLAPGRSLRV